MTPVTPSTDYARTMRQIEELVATLLPAGMSLYHLDLVVAVRHLDSPGNGHFQRLPMPGSDPLTSLGALVATTDELRVQLNPRLRHLQGG
jgi:hypothetical protein